MIGENCWTQESLLETRVKNILTTFTNWKQTDGMMHLNGSVDMYIDTWFKDYLAFPGDSDGKASSCNAGRDRLPTPLAWRIPWTKEPGRLQPTGTTERLTLSFSCFQLLVSEKSSQNFYWTLKTGDKWKVMINFLFSWLKSNSK